MKTIHSKLFQTTAAAVIFSLYLLPAVPDASAVPVSTDANWLNFPEDGNWNNGDNWDTESAPNGTNDRATFTNSNITTITLGTSTSIGQITFTIGPSGGKQPAEGPEGGLPPSSSAFTIQTNGSNLDFYGAGIINNSGKTQTIINGGSEEDPTDRWLQQL
jgi:hypothetical protein